jgi:hypothetical protein
MFGLVFGGLPARFTTWFDHDRRPLTERCVSFMANNNCPYGFMDWFDYAAESAFSFANTSALNDTKSACNVTRGIITSTSFYGVNIFTSIANPAACAVLKEAEFVRRHIAPRVRI